MPSGPRLRQVALVARDRGQVAGELRRVFGWPPPFITVELPDSRQRLRFVAARG